MEDLRVTVTNLTGAVNALLEKMNSLERRVSNLDAVNSRMTTSAANSRTETVEEVVAQAPITEADIRDISRLPDCVKELQIFDGNPVQYVSWVHSVEVILSDFEIVKGKPLYRAILQHIRQKVRGAADSALISYNIFDSNWLKIKECLSLHYADKRDIRTLEHQLHQLHQRGSRVDEFYARVNHQFSLIINKIKTESYTDETVRVLVETYRNRALDVFIRGLNGDLSRMLLIQRPRTLPEAYSACLEIQNVDFRNSSIHPSNANNRVSVPTNNLPSTSHFQNRNKPPQSPAKPAWRPQEHRSQYSRNDNPSGRNENQNSTSRPPVEKMEVDPSVQTRNANYINRPNPFKRGAKSENLPRKQQKVFHTVPEVIEEQEQEPGNEEKPEDFLDSGHLAYHT